MTVTVAATVVVAGVVVVAVGALASVAVEVELVAVLNSTSLLPNRSTPRNDLLNVCIGHLAGPALITHFLVILQACVYLSDLYKYLHTVTALWAWSLEFLGSVHRLEAVPGGYMNQC